MGRACRHETRLIWAIGFTLVVWLTGHPNPEMEQTCLTPRGEGQRVACPTAAALLVRVRAAHRATAAGGQTGAGVHVQSVALPEKERRPDTRCDCMGGSQTSCSVREARHQGHVPKDSVMTHLGRAKPHGGRLVAARSWGCGLSFGVMRMFWNRIEVVVAQHCEHATCH